MKLVFTSLSNAGVTFAVIAARLTCVSTQWSVENDSASNTTEMMVKKIANPSVMVAAILTKACRRSVVLYCAGVRAFCSSDDGRGLCATPSGVGRRLYKDDTVRRPRKRSVRERRGYTAAAAIHLSEVKRRNSPTRCTAAVLLRAPGCGNAAKVQLARKGAAVQVLVVGCRRR